MKYFAFLAIIPLDRILSLMNRRGNRGGRSRIPNTRLKRALAVILVSLKRAPSRGGFYLRFLQRLLDRVLTYMAQRRRAAAASAAVATLAVTTNLPPPLEAGETFFQDPIIVDFRGGESPEPEDPVFTNKLIAADIDGDGDNDIVSADLILGLRWHENVKGDGSGSAEPLEPDYDAEGSEVIFNGEGGEAFNTRLIGLGYGHGILILGALGDDIDGLM